MGEAPWRSRPGIPAPAHRDRSGPWWESPDIAHWWVRPRWWIDDDTEGYEARHQDGHLPDVTAPSLYLLGVFTQHRFMRYVHDRWDKLPIRQMAER